MTIKNKFNPGQDVTYIGYNPKYKQYEMFLAKVESVALYIDKAGYYLNNGCDEIPENELFTQEEAMKYLEKIVYKNLTPPQPEINNNEDIIPF